MDIPAHTKTAHNKKRLEEDFCWIVCNVPLTTWAVTGLKWTDTSTYKFGANRYNSYEDVGQTSHFWGFKPFYPHLDDNNPIFSHKTLSMTIHQCIRYRSKAFCSSEVRMDRQSLEDSKTSLWLSLWRQQSNSLGHSRCTTVASFISNGSAVQKIVIVSTIIFWGSEPSL